MSDGSVSPPRLRVLWLIKGLGPGGAEQLLLLSARVADRERFEHKIAYVRPDKTHLVPEFEAAGFVPVRLGASSQGRLVWSPGRLGRLARPLRRLGWLGELRGLIAESDVVHAHSPVLAAAARVAVRTLPRDRRPVIVTTEHNEWTSHRLPTRLANGLTAGFDDHHWAVSDQVKATVWRRRRPGYDVLIHGIDTSAAVTAPDVREQARAELGLGPDHVLSLTVANLRRNKDYSTLLRAARIALDRSPQLRFAAVGQGPLAEEIAALHAELGLGDRFALLGFRRDVPALMAAADVFTLSSVHEGLPVAVMEAFAAGLPVVATRVGGLPHQVHDGNQGRLVPPGDPEALATALVDLAGWPEQRAAMASAAKASAAAYDIRAAVAAQERVYLDLTAVRARPPG